MGNKDMLPCCCWRDNCALGDYMSDLESMSAELEELKRRTTQIRLRLADPSLDYSTDYEDRVLLKLQHLAMEQYCGALGARISRSWNQGISEDK